jgi:hypothetical protein
VLGRHQFVVGALGIEAKVEDVVGFGFDLGLVLFCAG